MDVQRVHIDPKQARVLYQDYKKHLHYSTPLDDEIRRTYQRIAQGRTVIKALESIVAAGLNESGLPKLAIVRADQTHCVLRLWQDGHARMMDTSSRDSWWSDRVNPNRTFSFPIGSFVGHRTQGQDTHEAIVPSIPVHLRPRRGLQNYHILWEAEWSKRIPVDPMLLRRMGKGDLWMVVAAWGLTEVERAALAARL